MNLSNRFPAHILASPPRRCAATVARLPSSILLTLLAIPSPNPPHKPALLPLLLHRAAQIPPAPASHESAARAAPPPPGTGRRAPPTPTTSSRGRGSCAPSPPPPPGRPRAAARPCSGWAPAAARAPPSRSPARLPDAAAALLRAAVLRALRFPLRSGGADAPAVLGPGGLAELDGVPRVAAVLFFGPRRVWGGGRVREMERRVDASGARIEAVVLEGLRWYQRRGWEGAREARALALARPRARFPVLELPTVEYCDASGEDGVDASGAWVPREYPVPVLPMLDILGEDKARELVAGTRFEGATWVALRSGPMFTSALVWLLRGAWWFMDE